MSERITVSLKRPRLAQGKRKLDIGAGHPFDLDVKDRLGNVACPLPDVSDM